MSGTYELVYVEDAGKDGSLEWLWECRQRDANVVVVGLANNAGQHRAVIEGLRVARGETVVVMDADLQDPPEQIPRLLEALRRKGGAVFARRNSRSARYPRRVTGRVFKWLLRHVAGSRIPHGTGMFLAMSRRMAETAADLAGRFLYVPLLLDQTQFPLSAISIEPGFRSARRSAYTSRALWALATSGMAHAVRWRLTSWREAARRILSTDLPQADKGQCPEEQTSTWRALARGIAVLIVVGVGAARFFLAGLAPAVSGLRGDFAAVFPTEYVATLRPDFPVDAVWPGAWSYGPMLHFLTLPLLLLPAWSLVSAVWAIVNTAALLSSFVMRV